MSPGETVFYLWVSMFVFVFIMLLKDIRKDN
jgi:hypothetical protein